MTCAKITIANTSDRCDEEPALVIVVVLDELDFGSCIVNLCCFCYLRTRYFLQRIAAMKASITPTSNITILCRGIHPSLFHHL
jgi:hypothetical protein